MVGLPRLLNQRRPMARLDSSAHDQSMTMTLLIVDDSDLIQSSLLGLLQGIPGIDIIHCASSLTQALECVRKVVPTFLILDLHLPDGNAVSMMRPMKQLAPEMEIAILTNDASELNRVKCLATGADWFFDKSMEYDCLLDVVKNQAAMH